MYPFSRMQTNQVFAKWVQIGTITVAAYLWYVCMYKTVFVHM